MASAFSAVRVKSDSSPAPCPFDDDRQGLNRKDDDEEEEVRDHEGFILRLLERKGRRRGARDDMLPWNLSEE